MFPENEVFVSSLKLIVASLVFVTTAAVAQKGHYTATLVQPLSAGKEVVANDNLWRCAGSICTLISGPRNADSIGSCHTLQKKVGALSAYGGPDNSFDADKLAKCNGAG